MGNGPSLSNTLKENEEILGDYDLIAVNFMGLFPEYTKYKPNIYVLCDPGFWLENIPGEVQNKVISLYQRLVDTTDWPLQLYIPYKAKKTQKIPAMLSQNINIRLHYYNKTKVEGFRWFQYMMLKKQWGMFRAENVLIAALLLTIYSKYKQIYIMGAESDWMKNIWVDENNCLRIDDTHFGGKGTHEIMPFKLHEICISLYYAFKSYMDIEDYSRKRGVKIYNANPYSFIDAFEKIKKI
jgi:hypothetical protein